MYSISITDSTSLAELDCGFQVAVAANLHSERDRKVGNQIGVGNVDGLQQAEGTASMFGGFSKVALRAER